MHGPGWFMEIGAIAALAGSTAAEVVVPGGSALDRREWRVSTFAPSAQAEAALAVDASGDLISVWSSRRQQSGRYGVYGRRFSAQGSAEGSETCLNLWTASHQLAPDVAVDVAGRVWTAWQSHGQDGSGAAIIARRFDAGWTGGSELLVNELTRGDQTSPTVAATADGGALVAWTSFTPATGHGQIRARWLGADGQAQGPELAVSAAEVDARTPAVAAGRDGSVAVVYAVFDRDRRPAGIRLRRLGLAGEPIAGPIALSGSADEAPVEPVVAACRDGYLVSWLDPVGGGYAAIARFVDGDGCPRGESFTVSPAVRGPHHGCAVAGDVDGRSAVAFNAPDGDDDGVFVQLFAPDGTRQGDAVRVNRHHAGRQAMRAAAGTRRLSFRPDGGLVCVWSGDGGLGDTSSVNMTVLSPLRVATSDRPRAAPGERPSAAPDGAAAKPHRPPAFDPARVDTAQRSVVLSPTGIGFTGIINTGWTPPDPHLAVGPEQVVVMTNGAIVAFTKTGVLLFQDEIEDSFGFWGGLGATSFVFDPEVIYDPLSGRFFAMASEGFAPGGQSFVLVAVSEDSTPTGADQWHKYRFNTTALSSNVFDSPNIAVDDQAVYITGDHGAGATAYPVFIFDKASLLAGAPPVVSNSFLLPTATESAGVPPVSFDGPPALYLIEHGESVSNSSVRLIAIQDPLGTPSFAVTNLVVPTYGRPEDPPQAGTSVRPETFDARFWSAAYRNGSLWATHHINSDRVLARWYEIAMNGWPDFGQMPSLVQSGTIDPGPGVRTFFSAITVDDHGNAAMTFARSSPSEFISMATAFRLASDPLGTFRPDVIHQTATGPYTTDRWGDYGAVNVDPTDGLTFWAHHEYAEGNSWRTWIASFTPPFEPADLDFDGRVGTEDLLILLAAWGPCPVPCPPACAADLDEDCTVGTADLLALLAGWS